MKSRRYVPSEKANSGPAWIAFLKYAARIGGKCAAPDMMEKTVAKSCDRSFLWYASWCNAEGIM